jgi:succinoglycan biosynthesis transport protein ExoP
MSRDFEILQRVEASRDANGASFRTSRPKQLRGMSEPLSYLEDNRHDGDDDYVTNWVRILRRRKWVAISFFVAVTALVSIATFLMTPKYQATATIAFSKDDNDTLGFKDENTNRGDSLDFASELDTQVKILQSDTLGEAVIDTLHLDQNPKFAGAPANGASQQDATQRKRHLLDVYHDNLVVEKEKTSRIITIQFMSADRKVPADVVNTLANAYIEHNFKAKFDATTRVSAWLSGQLAELQKNVQSSQELLVAYQKAHGIIGGDEKQNVVTTALEELNHDYTAAQADRIQKEVAYRIAQSGDAELMKSEPDALIDKLHTQEAELRTEFAKASAQLGPAHPKVIELTSEIQQIDTAITNEREKLRMKLRDQYQAAVQREKMSRSALESQKQAASELNESAIQYDLLKHDVDSNRALYETLLTRMKEASVTAGLKSSNIQILDSATVPIHPSKPDVPKNIGLGVFFGLFGGILLAFVWERFDPTLRTAKQVELLGQLPALALVPLIEAPRENRSELPATSNAASLGLTAYTAPISAESDAYTSLLDSIFLTSQQPPFSITVTSSLSGEGKTRTAINLAVALAKQGRRVLFVDMDLRKPPELKPEYLQGSKGLTAVLRRQISEKDAMLQSPEAPGLTILPAGSGDISNAELLTTPTLQRLFAGWRREYEHVVIDSAPVLGTSEAVRVAAIADSVVLVVRADQTTRDAFYRAQAMLRRVNARMAGVVFNGVDFNSPEFAAQYSFPQSNVR